MHYGSHTIEAVACRFRAEGLGRKWLVSLD